MEGTDGEDTTISLSRSQQLTSRGSTSTNLNILVDTDNNHPLRCKSKGIGGGRRREEQGGRRSRRVREG